MSNYCLKTLKMVIASKYPFSISVSLQPLLFLEIIALNLRLCISFSVLQPLQILTNYDEVENWRLSSFLLAVHSIIKLETLQLWTLYKNIIGGGDSININMCGTLEFMSPEVMRCSHASPASDMWSVGVILYFLVSAGLSPFWGGTEYRTQRNVLR